MQDHSSNDATAPRWRRRADARPEEILAAALQVFVEKGFANAKLTEIAEQAGVTKGTVYYYFASKEALLKAVIRDSIVAHLISAEGEASRYRGPMRALLQEMVLRWWQSVQRSGVSGLAKLVVSEARNFPELAQFYMDEVVLRGRRIYADILRRGIEAGEFRRLDIDCMVRELTSPLLFTAVWMHSMDSFEPKRQDYDAFVRAHLDIVLNGISASPDKE